MSQLQFFVRVACCLMVAYVVALPVLGEENPGKPGNGNVTIGPDYKIDPDLTDKGNPKGKAFEFTMKLADSKIFRGDDSTLDPKKPVRKQRKIFVYVPAEIGRAHV